MRGVETAASDLTLAQHRVLLLLEEHGQLSVNDVAHLLGVNQSNASRHTTRLTELGFVALSQVIADSFGSRWVVPEGDHAPIEQQAVLLKTGQDDPAAKAFLAFLKGPEALKIIKRYGYGTP